MIEINDHKSKAIIASIISIKHLIKDANKVCEDKNDGMIKNVNDLTQEDLVVIRNYINYISIHINLIHNNVPEILEMLQTCQTGAK